MQTEKTLEQLLEEAQKISNHDRRAQVIQNITNKFFDVPSNFYHISEAHEGIRDLDADNANGEVSATTEGKFYSALYIPETVSDAIAFIGGNRAWNEAIKLIEINATPEGLKRAHDVATARNRDYTKIRTRVKRNSRDALAAKLERRAGKKAAAAAKKEAKKAARLEAAANVARLKAKLS